MDRQWTIGSGVEIQLYTDDKQRTFISFDCDAVIIEEKEFKEFFEAMDELRKFIKGV